MHGPISPATVRDAAIDWRFPVHESLMSAKVPIFIYNSRVETASEGLLLD